MRTSTSSVDRKGPSIEVTLSNFSSLLSSAITPSGEDPSSTASNSSLSCFLSDSIAYTKNNLACTIPSLSLKNKSLVGLDSKSPIKEISALSLAYPVVYSKNSIQKAPSEIIHNVSSSFMTLIDARLRGCTSALLKQAMSKSSPTSLSKHLKMMVTLLSPTISRASPPIDLSTIVTSFQVLPFRSLTCIDILKESVLPLVLNTTVDLVILGTLVTVSIQAPGTIFGSFSEGGDGLLSSVLISFDTVATLENMMKQARFAVKKAITLSSLLSNEITLKIGCIVNIPNMSLFNSAAPSNCVSSAIQQKAVEEKKKTKQKEAKFSLLASGSRSIALSLMQDSIVDQKKNRGYNSIVSQESIVMPTGLTTAENEKMEKNTSKDTVKSLVSSFSTKSKKSHSSSLSRRPHKKRKFMSCPSL